MSNMRLLSSAMLLLGSRVILRTCGFSTRISRNVARYPRNGLMMSTTALSDTESNFLEQAVDLARRAHQNTFPNPVVGCVLVRQDTNEIVGQGFHPRAGFPHAEVFALLEAAKHVDSGTAAAQAVVDYSSGKSKTKGAMVEKVETLLETYKSENGAKKLFGDIFADTPITAFVTLEPCCHYGRTPPCALSFAEAQVDRVIVGVRDPNPRVAGGGVDFLRNAGVLVDVAEGSASESCGAIARNFCRRITPSPLRTDYGYISGAMRSALRSLANSKKAEGSMVDFEWEGAAIPEDPAEDEGVTFEDMLRASANTLLPPSWMERVDDGLWDHELILLRLNRAVSKKKKALALGTVVAEQLQAHVAQSVGHTILLYRPSEPAVFDLEQLVSQYKKKDGSKR